MSAPDVATTVAAGLPDGAAAVSFMADILEEDASWASVVIPIAVALLIAFLIDRALSRRGRALAETVIRGELSPETGTRLRFIRRLLDALIITLGVAIAVSRVNGVDRVAASLLASGAIAAAVVGFAARQTLANFVAGIMLAITQPIRVGDWVFFEEQYGVVDDIRLTYTFLRTPGGQQVVVPNERLASGILRNDSLGDGVVGLDVQIWLPAGADAGRAVRVLEEETGQTVTVAETAVEGVRIAVGGEPCPPPERAPREAALRLQCLDRLRTEGLLATAE
jgi:small-conductance mechanosensitive channel